MVGRWDGQFDYFLNEGNATHAQYQRKTGTGNPLDGQDIGADGYPALGDLDADGDLDPLGRAMGWAVRLFSKRGQCCSRPVSEVDRCRAIH